MDVDEQLRTLIAAERQERPQAELVTRGWERLDASLTGPITPPIADASPNATASKIASAELVKKAVVTAVLVGGIAGGIVSGHVMRSREPDRVLPPVVASLQPVESVPQQPSEDMLARLRAGRLPPTPAHNGHDESDARSVDALQERDRSLGAEVALLREIERALRSQDYAAVLRRARTHARQFPHGLLIEERMAAELMAACATEAAAKETLRRRFFSSFPRSPHILRIDRVCGTPAATTEDHGNPTEVATQE